MDLCYNKVMNIPITQSQAWQNLQNDLGEVSFLESTPDFHYLAIKKSAGIGNYLYLPYGPILKDQTKATLKKALESLQTLAKKERAIFIRIEPESPEIIEKMRQALNPALNPPFKSIQKSHNQNPAETWLLDLTGTDDALTKKLPSRLLRYYKNAAKQGITIETSHNPDDIIHLLSLQKALAREKHISTFSENYLKTELAQPFATLYLLKQQGTILAAGLVFDDATTRYNLQGAQSDEGRRLHATGILTIQLIKDAKAKNLQTFDFWGIAPDGAPKDHPWAGFTAFKKTFAGSEKKYAGTYDLILNPVKYKLYQFLRRLRRAI